MTGFLRKMYNSPRVISDLELEEALGVNARGSHTGRRAATPDTAMTVATVFACVRILANNIAQLPLRVYRTDSQGRREEAKNHPAWQLFMGKPNMLMGPFIWKQTTFSSVLLRGNTYNQIEFGGDGWPAALWPLHTAAMNARLERRRPIYDYSAQPEDKIKSGKIEPGRIHHLRSMANDGFLGRSVVRQAMNTIALTMAAEEFGARFFGDGAQPGVALSHPNTLSPEAMERLRKSWDNRHAGLDGAHKTAILEEGMSVERIGIPPEEAQFLGTRTFQTLEICRWFGVPPHMAYDLERATFSNIEHQSMAFVQDSLMPWIVNHEEQLKADVIEREGYESNVWAEYDVNQRLRGDRLTRARANQIEMMYGQISPNEARAKENRPPYTGGDQMFMSGNLVPIEQVGMKRKAAESESGDDREENAVSERREREQRQDNDDSDVQVLRDLWSDATAGLQERLKRLIEYEASAVSESLQSRTLSMFVIWLQEFYADLADEFVAALNSPLSRLAVRTGRTVVLDLDESWTAELRAQIEAFAGEVLESMAAEYAASHRRQLEALVNEESIDEAATSAVEERLNGWLETESERKAHKTAFEAGNAVAMAAMAAVGIVTVSWAARGSSCKYCRALDGKVIEIGRDFVPAGGAVTAADGESMTVSRRRGHPPLHEKCDCGTRAVRE